MLSSTVTYTSVYSDFEPWRSQWVSDDEPQSLEAAPQLPEQAPPSTDYVPGLEHPSSPDYVPGPKIQRRTPKEDPADYPADEGDDDDDDEEEEEEEEAFEEEEDEEEEHLALADSTTLPAIVRSAEDT
ncbi:hypothetical protein Tco_0586387 [Tanacetum coccineum]